MSYNIGDNPLKDLYANLTKVREAQTTAKANETAAKETMDTLSESILNGTSTGGVARQAATQAMVDMGNAYTAYNATLKPYEDANATLNRLLGQNPPASDSEIQSAKEAAERAFETRDNAYNTYLKAQEDWKTKDDAADQAEGEDSVELEKAVAEHSLAVQTSKEKDDEVKNVEEAIAQEIAVLVEEGYTVDENGQITSVPETEETIASQPLMTEEEAISEGYTVIHNYEELLAIANNLNGKYILMGDIQIPEGINWTPIGDANSPFMGEFNGNGCKITGLNIDVTEDDVENVGFFGVTDGAKISNVNIVDAKINGIYSIEGGTENAGILVGLARGTSFDNINVSGTVNAYAAAGGMIGAIDDRSCGNVNTGNSIITNCNTNVTINSQYYAGGLVGYVYGTESRLEDHRGIVSQSLIIRNCHTSGSASAGEESVGGLIGESGKTLITLDKCTSDMDLYWTNPEDDSDLSFLLETGRIGGMVGNINGSYITFANCEFNGSLNGDTEFQSKVYGWYMDDSHVTIYDLPAGLPVDDILNIDGIDGMKALENGKYLCTVSTLSGLDKMVAMIKANPELADLITWQINFDFSAMDGAYDYSEYAQYGIVQHLYEDKDGNVANDVYIDNECDLETTYHSEEPQKLPKCNCQCNGEILEPLTPSIIPGLWKNSSGDYFVLDEFGERHQVDFSVNADDQICNIDKRLTSSEVAYRERLVELGKRIQQQMRDVLKDMFNWDKDTSVPVITKAEYKKLLKKAEKYGYDSLTNAEKLSMAVFEVDYDIMNAQAKYTRNMGCGMGGNASFLDKTTTYQMYDANGKALFTTLDGDSLVGIYDDDGNITGYKYADTDEPYYGMSEIFEQRGYQNTDENGNLLFTHTAEDGTALTVTQIKGEDGSISYVTTDADGNQIPFEGDVDSLERQLTPVNYAEDYESFQSDLEQILQDVKDGKYPKDRTSDDNTVPEGEETGNEETGIDNGEEVETDSSEESEGYIDENSEGDSNDNPEDKKPEDEV